MKFSLTQQKHTWKKNFHEEDQLISFTEYGLEGETEKNWSELITVHCFNAKCDFSLQEFFETAVSEVTKNHPYNKVKAHIGNFINDTLLADWWIKDQSVNDQHEWVKIVKKENQVAILRYTTKRIQQEAISVKFWENLLKETTFE
ncbi:MAG TPA: hypothetical protein PLC42_08135 [Parachlamydiaceae bacterium]|nr:hypothetical protein [Parachlamydiaceae bacterium]